MTHRWDIWSAAFFYFRMLGSVRRCGDCGSVERACLGGYRDERCNRVAEYLTRRLAR